MHSSVARGAAARRRELLADLSQAELAKRLNHPQSFVVKLERGRRRLDVFNLVAIIRALRVDPGQFIDEIGQLARG